MFVIRFGVPESRVYTAPSGEIVAEVASPVISGAREERFPIPAGMATREGDWAWCDNGDMLCGAAAATVSESDFEAVSGRLYDALFEKTRGLHLYRVWNHVPAINTVTPGREENYKRFCLGRACAFERAFPADCERRMPAASAIGVGGTRLVVVVIAGRVKPEHFENPEQTPAYRYPPKYGPKPPSFARATRVRCAGGEWVFVSGTASIKGSESLHPGDFPAQAAVTADNLAIMRRVTGLAAPTTVLLRTYVKPGFESRPVDARALAGGGCESVLISADICRAELLLESELTMHSALP